MNENDEMKNQQGKSYSRRNFLGTVGAATAAFTIIPSHVMAGRGYQQPSDTVNVAGVGVGARGASNIQGFCDPVPLDRVSWRIVELSPGKLISDRRHTKVKSNGERVSQARCPQIDYSSGTLPSAAPPSGAGGPSDPAANHQARTFAPGHQEYGAVGRGASYRDAGSELPG